jgi:hypothetical protein
MALVHYLVYKEQLRIKPFLAHKHTFSKYFIIKLLKYYFFKMLKYIAL